MGSIISTSLAAQVLTSPVLLYYFGYLSGWGLLLNFVFVPLIGAVFAFLLLAVAIACILPTIFAFVLLYIPNIIWSCLLLVFQTLDFSSFALRGIQISVVAMLPYVFACLFLSDKWNISRPLKYILSAVCCCAFVATMYALNI